MTTVETIESGPDLRVRLVLDEDPQEPYDDGGSPILRLSDGRQVTNITSHRVSDRIEEAAGLWEDDPDTFERYVRIFHGATEVRWFAPWGSGDHVTFDTAAWRQEMGLPADPVELVAYAQDHNLHPGWLVNADEYRAYLEGEVYGYVVEERATWTRTDDHAASDPDTMHTWETVDSCFGFYGFTEYLKESARNALASVGQED